MLFLKLYVWFLNCFGNRGGKLWNRFRWNWIYSWHVLGKCILIRFVLTLILLWNLKCIFYLGNVGKLKRESFWFSIDCANVQQLNLGVIQQEKLSWNSHLRSGSENCQKNWKGLSWVLLIVWRKWQSCDFQTKEQFDKATSNGCVSWRYS